MKADPASGGLILVEQALEHLLSSVASRVVSQTIPLRAADGRVLLDDVYAACDVPPCDNSAMDGYAINSREQQSDQAFTVSARIPAGCAAAALSPGTVARIFTGAPVPKGADAVIMQENCEASLAGVLIRQAVAAGENIRRQGADVLAGSLLFKAGHRLRPADLGVLAATGVASVRVGKQPVVALFSTGNELVEPGHALASGQIYNSNIFVVRALLQRLGLQVIDLGIAGDTRDATEQMLLKAAELADCVISTGGVSAGEEDHVRAALQHLGKLELWKLALKPGKPFAFGRLHDSVFFGLPGNPVSAFVTLLILVRPALLAMMGARECTLKEIHLPAGFDAPVSGSRQEYLRIRLTQSGLDANNPAAGLPMLVPLSDQSSGVLSSVVVADGLAIVPPFTAISSGQLLRFLPFGDIV